MEHSWDFKYWKSFPQSGSPLIQLHSIHSKFAATYNIVGKKKKEKCLWFENLSLDNAETSIILRNKRQTHIQKKKKVESQDTEVITIWILNINIYYL